MLEQNLHPLTYEDAGTQDPWQYFEIARKRIFYAVVPFILVLATGAAVARFWPRTYLSKSQPILFSLR
jgi:hypothetical protein